MKTLFFLIWAMTLVACGEDDSTEQKVDLFAVTDLKSCKARSYSVEVDQLGLTNENWCGDFGGRFSEKRGLGIYDKLLKGYWGRSNGSEVSWKDANNFCKNLGSGWKIPDAYKMLSLFSKYYSSGNINWIFRDNNRANFWSSTKLKSDPSRVYLFRFDAHSNVYSRSTIVGGARVRCFRAK